MNGWTILKILAAYEAGIAIRENVERHNYWHQAREYADSVGKPLLVVGMKRWPWQPRDGDITVDIDPAIENIPGGVWADERDMPFSDKEFGAVYNAHTLEHMATIEDAEQAVNESVRVADRAIFLCPSPYSIIATFFAPSHKLRLWFDQTNNRIRIGENTLRTGWGYNSGDTSHPPPGRISQALVTDRMPEIVKIGSAYII